MHGIKDSGGEMALWHFYSCFASIPGGFCLGMGIAYLDLFWGGGGCLNVGEMWHAVIGCEMLGVGRMRGLN